MNGASSALPAPGDGPALDVEADLAIEVDDGAGGRATGRLTGNGQRLRLVVDHPEVLTGSSGRSMVRGLAAQLAAAGIYAEVQGPRGRIATLDPERHSRLNALVVGSPHVAFERAAWPLALRAAASRLSLTVALSAAVVAATLAGGLIRRRT